MSLKPHYEFPTAKILVFAKAPVSGRVKTRLARRVGNWRATQLYRAMLIQTLTMLVEAGLAEVELCCAPSTFHGEFHRLRRRFGVRLMRQASGGLGRRMHVASQRALLGSESVLILGGDCVSLDADYLRKALQALNKDNDAVLGPAEDGGYVMIGVRRAQARLFLGMTWSHPRVAAKTRGRLRRIGSRWAEMETRWDLDDYQDLKKWLHSQ